MSTFSAYPGTPQHKALLQCIIAYYQDDSRILALTLFGSLARGTWDEYSDLDLDVVLRDHVKINVLDEIEQLCATFTRLGEQALLIAPNGADAADVVLASLGELSIRYHPLETTSPNIVESVQLLSGQIPVEQLKAAGAANARQRSAMATDPFDTFVRLALAVDRAFHREQFWQALALLERMRTIVVEVFARSQGGGRPYPIFQMYAPATLREQLGATLPQPTLPSAQQALLHLLDIVERPPGQLIPAYTLSTSQRIIIAKVRQRQQSLRFGDRSE